jgi:hypothetical protein
MGLAKDEELIFTVPTQRLQELLMGLRHVEEYGSKFPRNPHMNFEPLLKESYSKIAKILKVGV